MGRFVKTIKRIAFSFPRRRRIIPVIKPTAENLSLYGKKALITGGTGGIGFAIAKELSAHGCRITIGGTNTDKLALIKEDHKSSGWQTCSVDYSNVDTLEKQLLDAVQSFGPFDFFISSAGVHTENVDYARIDAAEFNRVVDINLKGTYFAVRIISDAMIKAGIEGKVILVSSTRGLEPAWSPYGISKWGVHGMTLGFAQQLASYGIAVNAIAPGITATPLIGYDDGASIESGENRFGRMIMPEEVASLVRALLVEGDNMITGEILTISGGRGRFDIR